MAVYTLFGQSGGTAAVGTGEFTLAVQFTVSTTGTLTGIWFYSGSGATALPATIALFTVTGGGAGTLVHSEGTTGVPISWSGAAASGWVRAVFTAPPALAASTNYKAAVYANPGSSTTWYAAAANYWSSGAGSGGITSGVITAPNNAGGDGGQDTFYQPGTTGSVQYPPSSFNASNYWVDPEVTTGVFVSPAALPGGTVNSRYSQTVVATGGTAPYTYAVTPGALPGWASLNAATGVISGRVPGAAGSSSFTVAATDSLSVTGTRAYTLAWSVPQPVGSPSGGPWTLVFNEEFDFPVQGPVTMVPDPQVWADHLLYGDAWRAQLQSAGDAGWSPHNKAGLSVAGSVLTIITRNETPNNPASVGYDPAAPTATPAGTTLTYTTGYLDGRPGFAFTYGYAEALIQVPDAGVAGSYHPAFWMNDPNGVWNQGPEYDITEWFLGGNSCTYWYGGGSVNTPALPGGDQAYHAYGVRWTPTDITFFVDGVSFLDYNTATFSYTATNASPCVFTAAGSTYANGTQVKLSGGTPPAGFANGTTYFVVSVAGAAFSLAATLNGTAINSTSTGSGSVAGAVAIITRPEHIYLNVQVTNPGVTTGYPSNWNVDYVRVWNVTGCPPQPSAVTCSPASGVPSAGQLTVAFPGVAGATSYRASACPVDPYADGYPQGWGGTPPYTVGEATGAASPLTITGLTNGMHYYVTVAAVNATGYSVESTPVPPITPPPPPPAARASRPATAQARGAEGYRFTM